MSAFPPPAAKVNFEQLDAECQAGFQIPCNIDVSLTVLAHLVMACQYALKAPDISVPAAMILRDFAKDAQAKAGFPRQLTTLINSGWK